jgi:hypothetical protein
MKRLITTLALMVPLAVGACGKAGPAAPPAPAIENGPPALAHKCPDPSIKDSSNPCSSNYYKPVKGSFKDQKTF